MIEDTPAEQADTIGVRIYQASDQGMQPVHRDAAARTARGVRWAAAIATGHGDHPEIDGYARVAVETAATAAIERDGRGAVAGLHKAGRVLYDAAVAPSAVSAEDQRRNPDCSAALVSATEPGLIRLAWVGLCGVWVVHKEVAPLRNLADEPPDGKTLATMIAPSWSEVSTADTAAILLTSPGVHDWLPVEALADVIGTCHWMDRAWAVPGDVVALARKARPHGGGSPMPATAVYVVL